MRRLLLLSVLAVASASATSQTGPPKHPVFQLDAQSKHVLVENAANLKVGDSYETVVKRLGKPSFDRRLVRKEDNRVIGRSLSYYVVMWKSGTVNERNDQLVDVFLDETDHVKSVFIRVSLEN